jgi:MFS family permease
MFAAMATTTAAQLPVFLTGALSVQIGRDLALGTRGLAVAVAAFFGSSALCSAGFGRLSDHIGGARMMRLGTIPATGALLWIGFGVHRFAWLVAALCVAGAANGAIQPAANRYLTRSVGSHRQGMAFGVKQAAIPAAALLSGLAVPTVAHTVGWRWAFVAAAVAAAAAGTLVRRSPTATTAPVPTETRGTARDVARQPGRPALLLLAVGVGCASGAANAMGAFFVLSAVSIGESDGHAGLVVAAASVASVLVRLGIGVRADRRSAGHLRLVAVMCTLGALGPALLAVGDSRLLVVAALIGYGIGWGWAGLLNFAVASTHPTAPGRATGLTQVGASAGSCLGPLAFGLIAARLGYPPAWIGAALLFLVAALVIRTGQRALLGARPVT